MEEAFDPFSLPSEVTAYTCSLIGMLGLNISDPIHKSVWEAFAANRRPDRSPLSFKLLPEDFEIPASKSKRTSYEWYIPKGILKSNWMNKYLGQIPSVIAIFCNLDWSDPDWIEKKNNLAATVQSVRTKIDNRNCRIALVLIQSEASVPGEDTGAAEKASTLCTTCNLPTKLLYLLPHSDTHLLGHIVRLENVLAEIAGGFYLSEIKTIRSHKDYLNKTSHQLLFVRHQYKLGFHNEMRSDLSTAVKHYGQAYAHLVELRSTDTNLHEIRICAAIINYKICRLDFQLNLPRDAIAQFRRHIDMFRQKTGPKHLIFEHYAWLSKQYKIFGDVFEEAVNGGLPAVQTQHPGFYYQQAAQYAVTRRKTAQQICKDITNANLELLDGWSAIEFYGQRPWRPGKHLLEPPEAERESDGTKALQYNDLLVVNHSDIVIPLFSAAISQFKKYRCPRIKRHLMVMMAEEYYFSKDPSKALALLNHVMWDYRNERWWSLLSSCSVLALKCAHQIASLADYIALTLEILGPRIQVDAQYKERVFNNLQKVLSRNVPDEEPNTSLDVSVHSAEHWSSFLQGEASINVDMTSIVPCLEVRATFAKSCESVDKEISIEVMIRNTYCEPIQLWSLKVLTSVTAHNTGLIINDHTKLLLQPNVIAQFKLKFYPQISDVNTIIKITHISAQLSNIANLPITLQWTGVGNEGVTVNAANTPACKEFSVLCNNRFDLLSIISEVHISSREPNLSIEIDYHEDALVWEWLPVIITIINTEESSITDVITNLELHSSSEVALQQTTQITSSMQDEMKRPQQPCCQDKKANIPAGQKHKMQLFVKSLTSATRTLNLTIHYNTCVSIGSEKVSCPSVFQKSFQVTATIPFTVNIETQSLKFEQVTSVSSDESFLVVPRINCSSHVPIVFVSSSLAITNNVEYSADAISQIEGTELCDGEVGVDCFCLKARDAPRENVPIPLGQYLLSWKRLEDNGASAVSVSVGLPSMALEDYTIWIDADVPAQGVVRSPLLITYTLYNKGLITTELEVTMHVSEAFMFAGHKDVRLRVLPGESEKISYIIYPLLAGTVQLPKLLITTDPPCPSPLNYEALLNRILPTHIYIMPQAKTTVDKVECAMKTCTIAASN